MFWPDVCIIEMKRPSEAQRLSEHLDQALEYWKRKSRETGHAGNFVVLCAFRRFEIYEPPSTWDRLLAAFDLEELPDRFEALDFLRQRVPRFAEDRAELTREAVALVTDVYNRLGDRGAAGAETLRHFILQSVWSAFAEDLGMIPEHRFSRLVEHVLDEPERSSADELGGLFEWLNKPGARPEHGVYEGVPYVNGSLFQIPARVHLERDELELLRQACRFNWRQVQPAIFGSLLEGALGRERVWAFGAHYTSEEDIRKVVGPTIVEPWNGRIDSCGSLDEVHEAQKALARYTVLDPACGSGNFLYIAYRELRRIENRLRVLERELRREAGLGEEAPRVPFQLSNMYGIELEPFAVELARVTLWIAHKLAVEELGVDEPTLPLADLSSIRRADALKVEWPRAEAIIGNPPYHGSQQIRSELGDDYADWLKREFGVGLKDYAVYWFRKAHEALPDGGRAGLVATNSVSQGRSREASLEWIVRNGGVITNAVSKEPWSGEAVVNVSIINWIKNPAEIPHRFVLDGVNVPGITAALRPEGADVSAAVRLPQNRGQAFQGPIPADGGGFILGIEEAESLLARVDASYSEVVRPYLTSDDIGDDSAQRASRYVIDFAFRPLEEAMKFPAALEIVRERVKPFRDKNRDARFRKFWWQFGRPRRSMREALEPLSRYIAGTRHGTRLHFCWCDMWTMASDATNVFAREDDYSHGVLCSSAHIHWARVLSSTIRTDIRYTPTSAFETFPWPQPTTEQREEIAEASRAVIERRQEICLERQIGLTKLYNELEEGAYRDLSDLHRRLNEAVAAAYGWPKSAAHDPAESNRRLLELNQAIAAGKVDYRPFD